MEPRSPIPRIVMTDEFKTPFQTLADHLDGPGEATYHWTRFLLLRGLGVVYLIAFLVVDFQWLPLLGESGLLPVERFLARQESVWSTPTLFWLSQADWFATALGWLGTLLAAVVVAGRANTLIMGVLWLVYLSFVNVGQIFWNYGWEMLLVEAGFLGIFLPPLLDASPMPDNDPPPTIVVWLYRWLVFRVMIGAGLIKLRGDACWTELTCLMHHYETQPIPNPVSWYLDRMPDRFHRIGVLWNHLVEVAVPFFVLGPRRVRHVAGALIVAFQAMLVASGNLSFLNLLTIVVALACFDDRLSRRLVPGRWCADAPDTSEATPSTARRVATMALATTVATLSINPVLNLVRPNQAMNRSYTPLHLVNTYGAFGGVTETRYELEIQGTRDETIDEETEWRAYRFPCKPGPVDRAPCVAFPYHYRLDWQIWFAAMREQARRTWMVSLAHRLLQDHKGVEGLLEEVPFRDEPPEHIRIVRYRYEFTEDVSADAWWTRERVGTFLQPVSLDSEKFQGLLRRRGLTD
jgi:hypothetical protein